MYISDIITTPPKAFKTDLQEMIYAFFAENEIAFERVENDLARTMEECRLVSEKLGCPIAKTLFLCNRQQTRFYLYVMPEDKPFVTREFSAALDISRVSFASEEQLRKKLHVESGAATLLCLLLESAADVCLAVDKSVLENRNLGCTDGSCGGYLKLRTRDVLNSILPRLHGGEKTVIL